MTHSWDGSVGRVIRQWTGTLRIRDSNLFRDARISFEHTVQTPQGGYSASHPPVFPGILRPGREADHSPSSSAEVRDTWSYASIPYTSS
jgi:hypothetical protein